MEVTPTSRPLKNVFEATDTRQKQGEKRSLLVINEHIEPVFNTIAATQVVFQWPTCINSLITYLMIYFLRLHRCRAYFLIPGTLSLLFFSHVAAAAELSRAAELSKMFKPHFNYTVTADDNILRIRDNFNPSSIENDRIQRLISEGKLADVTNRMTGGVMFEKQISRQRFTADFNWTYTKFERFSSMDNNLKSANGKWNWVLGNRLEGNMGATYVESLMPFLFQPALKIIRTEQTQFINGAWRLHPNWRLVGEYTHYSLDTGKNPRAGNLNRTENQFEAGIDYLTADKNTVGVLFRNILGDFTSPIRNADGTLFLDNGSPVDNGYDQKEVLAKVNWAVTAKSHVQSTAGWVQRKNVDLQQRDFSGFNGRITYQWQPTDKLGLAINGWRLTSSMQNLTANFSLNTGVSVIPSWNITQKIRLEGNFSYETRNFNRFSDITDPNSLLGRHNTLRNAAIKLVYSPYPSLQLSTSIYHTDLSTKSFVTTNGVLVPENGFNANGVTANLQYIYGQR